MLSGLFIPYNDNSSTGQQTSHLVGIINAIVLIVFGLISNQITLSSISAKLLSTLSIYSMYAIWLSIVFSAPWNINTSKIVSIVENISYFLLYSGILSILLATILLISYLLSHKAE